MLSWYHHIWQFVARTAGSPHPHPGSRRRRLRPKVEALEECSVPSACKLAPLVIQFPPGGPNGMEGPAGTMITIGRDDVFGGGANFGSYLKNLKGVSGAGGQLVLNPGSATQPNPNETVVHVRVTLFKPPGGSPEIQPTTDVHLDHFPEDAVLRGVTFCLPGHPPKGCHGPAHNRGQAASFGGFGGGIGGFGGGPTCHGKPHGFGGGGFGGGGFGGGGFG